LGADVVFDYRDKKIVNKLKGTVSGVKLQLAFNCVGASTEVLEQVVEPGGSIILALPPTSQSSTHHVEMAIAGTVHDLETFRAPEFKFHEGVEPHDTHGAGVLRSIMQWTLQGVGTQYQPPRVRRLAGHGMHDAFEAFALMRQNRISGEKVVWRMAETPNLGS
jgi:NADPH:quinone reductase-like Zn-dependent oxidoreductase